MTREEAIEMLKKDKEQRGECFISEAIEMAIKALEQEPKTGHWIPTYGNIRGKFIPNNATNGDMIMAMFPNAKVRNSYYTYCVEVKLEYHSQYDTGLLFDKKWWNTPYKAESEVEDEKNK